MTKQEFLAYAKIGAPVLFFVLEQLQGWEYINHTPNGEHVLIKYNAHTFKVSSQAPRCGGWSTNTVSYTSLDGSSIIFGGYFENPKVIADHIKKIAPNHPTPNGVIIIH